MEENLIGPANMIPKVGSTRTHCLPATDIFISQQPTWRLQQQVSCWKRFEDTLETKRFWSKKDQFCPFVFLEWGVNFLLLHFRMIGISKGSSKALCFVIDTSNSMRDNIEAVKTVTSKIIKSDSGTDMQPSSYILVTFSDPGRDVFVERECHSLER